MYNKMVLGKRPRKSDGRANRRRVRRRVMAKPLTRSMVSRDTHSFARSYLGTTLTGNVAYAPYLAGISWDLASLPNASEFANLYDRYKITHVKCLIHLKVDPSAQTAATASFPKLYYIKDYDDANTPASINELREHSRCQYRVMNPNRPVTINVKPAVLSEVYRTAVTTTYTPRWKQWIDMAATNCPHYGLKIAIDDLTNTNYKVDFEYKVWFTCRNTR